MTLDGFFEDDHPWTLEWHNHIWGEELERFSIEQLSSADALLFGRVTYEGMAAYWKTEKGEVADYMNRISKIVCSRSLKQADWANTTLMNDDAEAEIRKLKQQGNKDIFVFGSADLSEKLMNAELFDEIRLALAPVVLWKWQDPVRTKLA
jgi:dihydrofolate reductase